jgi:DNA-binding FadR family transcriptional regulator
VHTWRKALEEHAAVVQAIAARDPEGARQQMHRHLQRSQSRYASMNMVATPARAA